MKPYLAFFVIFLTAVTLSDSISDILTELVTAMQSDEVMAESSARLGNGEEEVYTCKPGEQLEITRPSDCAFRHFKGCQMWLNPNPLHASTCWGATFEDCYVNIKGVNAVPGGKIIRSIVEVHEGQSNITFNTAIDCTVEDSIVICPPATHRIYGPGMPAEMSYPCNYMTFVGHNAYNIPSGVIYPPGVSDDAEYTEKYTFCYGGASAPSCNKGLYYSPDEEDPLYVVKAESDRSCCLSSVEDSRECLSTASACSEISRCNSMAVVEGGLPVAVIPGLGKRLNAILYCTSMNGTDSDCYLEACRNENGCGKEWNFFTLVNDTMSSALEGVREAWKSIVNLFPSGLVEYLNYCGEIYNSCETFGDDSVECYRSRANTYAPNSVNDPRSLLYPDVNLELRLKAQQKSYFIQDFNEGRIEYPRNMRYNWKNITQKMMRTLLISQRMLRSLCKETVIEGMSLLDELDATLQAVLLVYEPEMQYTSYHGVLLQIMAVARGYSCNPAPLPSSGLLLPIYSADFLLGKFRRMKEDMTYQMLSDRFTDVITAVNEDTLDLLAQNALELKAEGAALQVEMDIALSEMSRAKKQMNNAEGKVRGLSRQLNENYEALQKAVEEHQEEQQAKFYTRLVFSFLSMSTLDFSRALTTDYEAHSGLGVIMALRIISNLALTVMDAMEATGKGDHSGIPALPDSSGDFGDFEAYLDDSGNTYKAMAKAANEALGQMGHAGYEAIVNDFTENMVPYMRIDDTNVQQKATKLLMDITTGMAYEKDKYDAMIAFASAAGRAAVATAQIVGLNQVIGNIENLQEDVEDALEEQELRGTIVALQMMLSSLNSADLMEQLCNAHMYVNGGEISWSIQHICGVEGGFAPTPELLEDLLDNKATLGDIVDRVGVALGHFENTPKLFYRQVPRGVGGTRTALFKFASKEGPHDNTQQFPEIDLGGFLSGQALTFVLYKGSPLLDSFSSDNFNNPMLVGYAALLDGVNITDPNANKYINIGLGFSKSFEVYNWASGAKMFLKPTSTEWPVSSFRPMYNHYCHNTPVASPTTDELFCFQTSISELDNPTSGKDDLFAFDSIYTSYTITLKNPGIIADMTEEERAGVSLSILFFYYNTQGQANEWSRREEIDQEPPHPEEKSLYDPSHKLGGMPIRFLPEPVGNMTILRAHIVNT